MLPIPGGMVLVDMTVFLSIQIPLQMGCLALISLMYNFFFIHKHEGTMFPCALVHWFSWVSNSPDELTGMWIVKPDLAEDGTHITSVIHIDTIFRAAHLMPVYGNDAVPRYLSFTQSLDAFNLYYVNKYIDHHAFLILFDFLCTSCVVTKSCDHH